VDRYFEILVEDASKNINKDDFKDSYTKKIK
jgi:hypothetical protein